MSSDIDFELALPPLQKSLIQDIVDDVGVNFDARIVGAAVRCGFQIADARRCCADEHKFVFKCAGREFSFHDIRHGIVGKGARGPTIVDCFHPDVVGDNPELRAKLDDGHAGLAILENQSFAPSRK